MCKDLTRDPDLKKHVAEFKEQLKHGSEAFLSGNYRRAAECYKAAKERVGIKFTDYEIDDRQYHIIKYAHCAALISLKTYDDIVKAIHALTDMETYKFSIPALYIQLARAYINLNRFKNAMDPLGKLQDILDNCPIFPTYTWPGTNETIQETTPVGLKDAIKELNQVCRMPHKPTAVCRFDNCTKISTHILPSDSIYISDPDFIGYVRMICEEKCHIEFHIPCWKSYKESICGIGKINDKDFLGRRCLTTDCVNSDGEPSQITIIEIIGSDGEIKSVNKLDPKTNVDSKKAKKRRCKLDDREKTVKPKRPKEKRVKEVKKPATTVEEDEDAAEALRASINSAKSLEIRKQSLIELRKVNFGLGDNFWDPRLPFYGQKEEALKAAVPQFSDHSNETVEVRDAKEFLFSYFMAILKDEGPLTQSEIEDLWKDSAGDFCDITVMLPNLKSMCELLTESTRFCQIEDYICLAEQLGETYSNVKSEVSQTVEFLMTGSLNTASKEPPVSLPDLVTHQQNSLSERVPAPLSSDEGESDDEEYNSGSDSDSEESEEEHSEEESNTHETTAESSQSADQDETTQVITSELPDDSEISLTLPKAGFTLQDMLDEMSRVKNMFMKTSEDVETSEKEERASSNPSKDKEESISSDAFVSAQNSSVDSWTTSTLLKSPESSNNRVGAHCSIEGDIILSDENASGNEDLEQTVVHQLEEDVGTEEDHKLLNADVTEGQKSECDKALQIDVATEEKDMQTSPKETTDSLSQTVLTDDTHDKLRQQVLDLSNQVRTLGENNVKLNELSKENNAKLNDLSKQIRSMNEENTKLAKMLEEKETLAVKTKAVLDKTLAHVQEEKLKHAENEKLMKAEFFKVQSAMKEKEDEVSKMKDMSAKVITENGQLKNDINKLLKDTSELKLALTSALTNINEFDSNYKSLESNMKTKLQKSFEVQLNTIKMYWESQINLLRKRCVEKISEMQSWFNMFTPAEVEDLPSWGAIRQKILQWGEISKSVRQIENDFQMKYSVLENKILRGEEVDDLSTLILPSLPEEPTPLPLDQIHKEITEKYIKKIAELSQLVVNQQVEIQKSKDASQQVQQLMSSFQMAPRGATPLTTAFGSLALQYSYPQAFSQTPVPTIPPQSQDAARGATAAKLFQADVQTLLQESSRSANFTAKPASTDLSGMGHGKTPPLSGPYPFLTPPPAVSPVPQVPLTAKPMMPPPPMGVAHNLLKASTALTEKKDSKAPERTSTPKLDAARASSSRESTPLPTPGSTPVPTPEKSKKKKKTKSESRDAQETKVVEPVVEAASVNPEVNTEDDASSWNVVLPKSAMVRHTAPPSVPLPESKLKNKRKLLDKLQLKFPTTPLKDLDEIVKLVREQNNGSLSGLPFDEIETRVERVVTKKQFQKSSTMGLDKFSESAWGTVKPQEIKSWSTYDIEECVICFEVMVGSERTRVPCNHEFHTQCLRKWLKEKSECPLCQKYTTMPDEFPALYHK